MIIRFSKFRQAWRLLIISMIFSGVFLTACEESSEVTVNPPQSSTTESLTPLVQTSVQKLNSNQINYDSVDFKVLDFAQRDYQGAVSLGVVFSIAIDNGLDLQKYLLLERRDGQRVDGAWILSKNAKEAFFTNIEPETEYLLTVYTNLKAVNGKRLIKRFKKAVTTRAVESSVSFARSSGILPLSHSLGLPVYSVNTHSVDIEFHRIKPEQILSFLQNWEGRSKASYYQLQQFSEQAELVYSARFDLPVQKNKRERVLLPIDHIDALSPAGVYLAVMKTAGQYDYRQAVSYFTRSDIGIHVRRYSRKLRTYVRSLNSGKALAGVKISLLNADNKIIETQTSNGQGIVEFVQHLDSAQIILAQDEQQMSLVNLSSPALDLSEYSTGQRIQYQNEAFFYAPRDIYRPGETVDISLLLRNFDGHPIPDIPLKAVIKRPDGQIMQEFIWYAQTPGYYYHQYTLAKELKTGQWRIEIQLPDNYKSSNQSVRQWSFSVEEFLPERLKLEFVQPQADTVYLPGEEINIKLRGSYLYGAPAAGNSLETRLDTTADPQAVKSLPGYYFGMAGEQDIKRNIVLDDIQLDDKGFADIKIDPVLGAIHSPLKLRLSASLYENGGRALHRQVQYRYWPAETLIGIRPGWLKTDSRESTDRHHYEEPSANSLLSFDIVNATYQGVLKAAENLQVKLIKKRRDYYWKYNDYEEWEMDYTEQLYPVFQQTISLSEGRKTSVQVPVEWGPYRLEVSNPVSGKTTAFEFNAGGSWYTENQIAQQTRPDKITLSLDKPSYQNGDVINLTLKSPFSGSGFVIVENSNGLLWEQAVELENSTATQIKIPVNKHWQSHDLYISSVLFNKPSVSKTLSTLSKKRAVGLIHLPLNRDSRKISLSVSSSDKVEPLKPLKVKIKAVNIAALKDKKIMVTLAAVDVGVLNVSNFKTPDPFAWFFAPRKYAVDSLDVYGQIIDGQKGIKGKQRFGGDMDLTNGGSLAKANVDIVSIFTRPVRLDDKGEVEIVLDIPDFNGQLRLMAVAFGASSFGHAQSEVIVAAPVVTQLSMPRFLALHDQSQLALDVHNLSGQEQELSIELSTDGLLDIKDRKRLVKLPDKHKQTVFFTIGGQVNYGLSDINMSLSNSRDITIKRHWQLAIRPGWPAIQRSQRIMLNNNEHTEIQLDSKDLIPQTLAGRLTISSQPPLQLAMHFEQLLKYPYGCLEQSTSSTYPWLFMDREVMRKLGLQDINISNKKIDFSKREFYLDRGIKRILAKQRANGGFGLWNNKSHEEFWLTAYATEFLIEARARHLQIPDSALKAALKRLQQYLNSSRPGYDYRYSEYPEHNRFAYKAYAAYVLSLLNQAPLGSLRSLFDNHAKESRSGLPLMHLGLALYRQGDRKRAEVAIRQALEINRQDNEYLGDYGSRLRDTSLMLALLADFDSTRVELKHLVLRLQDELAERHWLSTQERNALFKAGTVLLKNSDNSHWQVMLDTIFGTEKILHSGRYTYKPTRQQLEQPLTIKSASSVPLYIAMTLGGYTQKPPVADKKHFSISRSYFNVEGRQVKPGQLAVGELLIVELMVQSEKRIQDALVIDLLPAGFELENQNLTHTQKLDNYRIGSETLMDRMEPSAIKFQQWREDRYIAAIDIKGHGIQRLYYLLRAVTPGQYQVPPPYAEDMYRPYIRAIGETPDAVTIVNRK